MQSSFGLKKVLFDIASINLREIQMVFFKGSINCGNRR